VTIPAYATPDEQTAKPWLHTILNNTGYKPVAHYVKRPLWVLPHAPTHPLWRE
jgi:hypothetical protein